ncbi:MAG: iron transporter [Thermoprotei archaeon]|nr:MAG: iron transporter [Thermoprotei archaeon]
MSKRLSELEPGDTAVIVRIEGSGAVARRMADMGLIPGTKVKVVRKAPLGDPIEFEVRGYNLSLRRNEAELVIVEVERS